MSLPPALLGRIYHRMKSSSTSSDVSASRKRPRTTTTTTTTTSHKNTTTSLASDSSKLESYDPSFCGLFFISNNDSRESLLSVPKELLKIACEAAFHGNTVCLRKFATIPLRCSPTRSSGDDKNMPSIVDGSTQHETSICMSLLEVHLGGLEIVLSCNQLSADPHGSCSTADSASNDTSAPNDTSWTLTQWWRKEMIDRLDKSKSSQKKVNIVATVDAISPIIVIDTDHPFALLEVYDNDNTDITSVVVMKGSQSLVHHTAISPLDTIQFRNVAYKAWSIPKESHLQHLINRIPSRVFVMCESSGISWDRPTSDLSKQSCQSIVSITPVNLITSIHGRVVRVRKTYTVSSFHETTTAIEYLDFSLSLDREENDFKAPHAATSDTIQTCGHCRLYVLHFPMSSALQWSLRKGTIVQASNIHWIGNTRESLETLNVVAMYGACLRSTLTILQCASDTAIGSTTIEAPYERSTNVQPTVTEKPTVLTNPYAMKRTDRRITLDEWRPLSVKCPWRAWAFSKIEEPYQQMILRRTITDWIRQNFRKSNQNVPNKWLVDIFVLDQMDGDYKNQLPTEPRKQRRCPYAEFFNHPYTHSCAAHDEAKRFSGCHFSSTERSGCGPDRVVYMVGLNEFRTASQQYVVEKIRERILQGRGLTYESVVAGWNGSIYASPREVLSLSNQKDKLGRKNTSADKEEDLMYRYFVGGFVSEFHGFSQDRRVSSIHDDLCEMPINFYDEKGVDVADGEYVVGHVDRVALACLCLGKLSHNAEGPYLDSAERNEQSTLSLPALSSVKARLLGACSLLKVDGLLFITAVQIHCHELLSRSKEQMALERDSFVLHPIEECLGNTIDIAEESSTRNDVVSGLLSRRLFCNKKNSDGSHKCCQITVASHEECNVNGISHDTRCLQCIQASVSVPQNTARMLILKEKLDELCLGENFSDAQKNLTSSFWALGDSGRTSALLLGGCEDIVSGSAGEGFLAHVSFPTSSIHTSRLGYVSARLVAFDFDSRILRCQNQLQGNTTSLRSMSPLFDIEGVSKLRKGTIHKRLRRRCSSIIGGVSTRTLGETVAEHSKVIPTSSLSRLLEELCKSLRERNTTHMCPSMVRRITKATLLEISYCKVQCICNNCSRPLMNRFPSKANRTNNKGNEFLDEPSFWHLPVPERPGDDGHNLVKQLERSSSSAADDANRLRASNLRCPNDCPLDSSYIKWECSAVLDDGTGQATVYADGDAAMTLLGISQNLVQQIEKGVWCTSTGLIIFKKTSPPSKKLRSAINSIQASTISSSKQSFRLLSLPFQSEYLLEHICRISTLPRRPLDYYIRCKPPPDTILHLQHTTLDSWFVTPTENNTAFCVEASSYLLPSLKLELVDCRIPTLD